MWVLGLLVFKWCPGTESNRRHEDFQSSALPTELPGQKDFSYNLQCPGCQQEFSNIAILLIPAAS